MTSPWSRPEPPPGDWTSISAAPPPPPVPRARLWAGALLDQCVLTAWLVFWFGVGFGPVGDWLDGSAVAVAIVVGVAGLLMIGLIQSLVLLKGRSTVGMWLVGVRPVGPSDPEDAMLWFVSFFQVTAAIVLSRVVDPRHEHVGFVRVPVTEAGLLARRAVGALLVLSPLPLILALVG